MSELPAIKIPKPRDEQAFERCNEILWRCVLKDSSAQLHGRRGQSQNGVDIIGRRDGKPDRIVGIQCKLKSEGKRLEEKEVREEVARALKFRPPLSEYIIATTAPDDTRLQAVALELSESVSKDQSKAFNVSIFGWNSLEREICRHPEAVAAFAPSLVFWGSNFEQMGQLPSEVANLKPKLDAIHDAVRGIQESNLIDSAKILTEWDKQINEYVAIISDHPKTALDLFQKLQTRFDADVPDRIRYRVMTNIAVCQLELGEEEFAAQGFIEAYDLACDDPKAIANKAVGLLLRKNWLGLSVFAKNRLPECSDNALLAACYISSLRVDKSVTDPLAHVPKEVHDTPEVIESHVRWLMDRGEHVSWWDIAIDAHSVHPDSVGLKELCACALLERASDEGNIIHDQVLDAGGLAAIQKAVEIYEARWSEIRDCPHRSPGDPLSVSINLMSAYRLLDQGERAIQVGSEALERFPENSEIKESLAAVLAEQGESDRAQEMVVGLQISQKTVVTRYNIALARKDWRAIITLVNEHLDIFPDRARQLVRATQVIASVELAEKGDRRAILEKEKNNFGNDIRALTRLAQCARTHEFGDLADSYLIAAQEAIDHDDKALLPRIAVAFEAMAQTKPRVAADILIDRIPSDRYSEELRLLAHALVTDYPIRERAIRFFDNLPSAIRDLASFQQLEGMLHINRGIPKDAIGPFSIAFEQQPSIENLMYLISAQLEVSDRNAIAELLQKDGIDKLPGGVSSRIDFCQILLDFGESARALDLGYRTLIEGLEDVDIVQKFFGLVVGFFQNHAIDDSDGRVASGVWVRLAQNQGRTHEVLLGEEADRPWGNKGDLSNIFLAKALDLRIGETFEHTNPVTGVIEIWTIKEVKPRWLQAFHYLSETFNQRFPSSGSFSYMTVEKDDIEPILELVRHNSERINVQTNLYLENDLPIAFFAGDRPDGSIALAQNLALAGKDVRVCDGTVVERTEALSVIEKHNHAGAVLDALTAWHAAILGIFPILSERLGALAIPASELHCLRAMIENQKILAGGGVMNLAYQGGQYIRHVATSEEHAEQLNRAVSYIEVIEESCNSEPLIVSDNLSELGEALIQLPRRDAMAPAILANETRLLLSEDMMMRQWAGRAYGTRGIWIQVTLLSAVHANVMPFSAYVDSLIHLASHRHAPIPIDARILFLAYKRDTNDELMRLQSLCAYVGHEGAEPVSHITVAADFINMIWADGSSDSSRIRTASNIVFGALLSRDRGHEWAKWATSLYLKIDAAPRDYLLDWCVEHSLPVDDVKRILQQARSDQDKTNK